MLAIDFFVKFAIICIGCSRSTAGTIHSRIVYLHNVYKVKQLYTSDPSVYTEREDTIMSDTVNPNASTNPAANVIDYDIHIIERRKNSQTLRVSFSANPPVDNYLKPLLATVEFTYRSVSNEDPEFENKNLEFEKMNNIVAEFAKLAAASLEEMFAEWKSGWKLGDSSAFVANKYSQHIEDDNASWEFTFADFIPYYGIHSLVRRAMYVFKKIKRLPQEVSHNHPL